jgi:imidazolonepropionase-like amidohydrolase
VDAIVFQNARIFDGRSCELSDRRDVRVAGNQIVEIGAGLSGANADIIDCTNKVLMPGLIDCHVHVYANEIPLKLPEPPITYRAQYAHVFLSEALAAGFTTVRDVGGGDHGLAMAIQAGYLTAPRYIYGGLCLSQTGGHGDLRDRSVPTEVMCCAAESNVLARIADGVDACMRAAREELRKGASHIKIMASGGVLSPAGAVDAAQYSDAEILAIVAECNRAGVYVTAHCHPASAIQRCVKLGVRCIEHATLIDEETAGIVAQSGAFVVPTIAILHALATREDATNFSHEVRAKLAQVYEHALSSLEIMARAGVKLGFGTDLLGPYHTARDNELLLRNRVQTPYEILHAATAVNAEILELNGKLGVIAAGALADILVVNGNPLEDLRALTGRGSRIDAIMLDGRFTKTPEASHVRH